METTIRNRKGKCRLKPWQQSIAWVVILTFSWEQAGWHNFNFAEGARYSHLAPSHVLSRSQDSTSESRLDEVNRTKDRVVPIDAGNESVPESRRKFIARSKLSLAGLISLLGESVRGIAQEIGGENLSESSQIQDVSEAGFTQDQLRIIEEEVTFFIEKFAPQLKSEIKRIATQVKIGVRSPERLEVKRDAKIFRWFAVIFFTFGSANAVWDFFKIKRGKQTRREMLKFLALTFGAGFASLLMGALLPIALSDFPLGLYSRISKQILILPQTFASHYAFRMVITHELVHFFGDEGLGILPRDSLFADAFATARILSLYGEDGLKQIFQEGVRVDTDGEGASELPRQRYFDLAKQLFDSYPDPEEREKRLRRAVMSPFPEQSFNPHPEVDGLYPWTYLYGTATGSIAYQLAKVHGDDFNIIWRYLTARARGISPSKAEELAVDSNMSMTSPIMKEELEQKLRYDIGYLIKKPIKSVNTL